MGCVLFGGWGEVEERMKEKHVCFKIVLSLQADLLPKIMEKGILMELRPPSLEETNQLRHRTQGGD